LFIGIRQKKGGKGEMNAPLPVSAKGQQRRKVAEWIENAYGRDVEKMPL